MFRRLIVAVVMVSLVMLMAGTCWASEKPLGDISSTQQVIDKLFAGRTLDPIEGIWVESDAWAFAIVKTSVIDPENKKYQKYDYLGINIAERDNGEINAKMIRTKYDFIFKENFIAGNGNWKLLSPSILSFNGNYGSFNCVRIYPSH